MSTRTIEMTEEEHEKFKAKYSKVPCHFCGETSDEYYLLSNQTKTTYEELKVCKECSKKDTVIVECLKFQGYIERSLFENV